MKKIFHLSTCNTCQRIIKEINPSEEVELQDIKTDKIRADQLSEMRTLIGSYEALFSRRAMKFRSMGLHEKELKEADYEKLILEEYTFLKRPVIMVDNKLFVGNSKKVVEEAKKYLTS